MCQSLASSKSFSVLFGLTFRPLIISGLMPYCLSCTQSVIHSFVSSHTWPAAVALTSSSFLSHRVLCCLRFSVSYPLLLIMRSPFFCALIVQIRLYYLVIFPTCSFVSVKVMVNSRTFIAPSSQVSTIPIHPQPS